MAPTSQSANPNSFPARIAKLAKAREIKGGDVIKNIQNFAPDAIDSEGKPSNAAKVFSTLLEIVSDAENLSSEEKQELQQILDEMPDIVSKLPEAHKNQCKTLIDMTNKIAEEPGLLKETPSQKVESQTTRKPTTNQTAIETQSVSKSVEQYKSNNVTAEDLEKGAAIFAKLPEADQASLTTQGQRISDAGGSVSDHKVNAYTHNADLSKQTQNKNTARGI